MRYAKRSVNPDDKASELVNLQDPSATVRAFDEAFERLMQAAGLQSQEQYQQKQQHCQCVK